MFFYKLWFAMTDIQVNTICSNSFHFMINSLCDNIPEQVPLFCHICVRNFPRLERLAYHLHHEVLQLEVILHEDGKDRSDGTERIPYSLFCILFSKPLRFHLLSIRQDYCIEIDFPAPPVASICKP